MFNLLPRRRAAPALGGGNGVFIYGTLRKGEANHFVMEELLARKHARLLSKDATVRQMMVVNIGGLPALYPVHPHFGRINAVGETYALSQAGFRLLDLFEGHPKMYRRQPVVCSWTTDDEPLDYMVAAYLGPVLGDEAGAGTRAVGSLVRTNVGPGAPVLSDWTKRLRAQDQEPAYIFRDRLVPRPRNPDEVAGRGPRIAIDDVMRNFGEPVRVAQAHDEEEEPDE